MPHERTSSGFTLLELLIVFGMLALLATLIFPIINGMTERGKSVSCLHNVQTMLMAYRLWIADNNGRHPDNQLPHQHFNYHAAFIPHYLPKELRCPSVPNASARNHGQGFRYAYNRNLMQYYPTLTGFPVPEHRIVLVSEAAYFNQGFWSLSHLNQAMNDSFPPHSQNRPQHHFGGLNLGFLDGHAELIKPPDNDWANVRGDRESGIIYHFEDVDRMKRNWGLN